MEHFNYKDGCIVTHIKALKEELALATYNWIQVISNLKQLSQ